MGDCVMERIGILGGTFNPLHIGHLAIAEVAQERMSLDRVIFVPSSRPPHKNLTYLAPAHHRLEMVRRAVGGDPKFSVSDFEVLRGGKSYTINTVRHFQNTLSQDAKLFFIVGGDSATHLQAWREIDEILKIVSFVVVNRPGHDNCDPGIPHHSVTMPGIDISSSYIRRRLREGKTIKYLVPEDVFRYIEDHDLYHKRDV